MFSMDATEKNAKVTAKKKFQQKGKDTQDLFPLTGILLGLLVDPSPPNWWFGLLDQRPQ